MLKTYSPALKLQRFFPFLEKKTAVLLHPSRARVADPFASKIAGQIAWPQNEEWARCPVHDKPMVSVLQLRRSDVPQLIFPDGKDIFQLLWCPTQDHEDNGFAPLSKTYWRDSRAIHNVLESAPRDFIDEDDECIPDECGLHVEEVEEYPSLSTMGTKRQNAVNKFIEQHGQEDINAVDGSMDDEPYSSLFDPAPMSKVGGHVSWIQDPETFSCTKCGKEMDHLLTISSLENGTPGSRWSVLFNERGPLTEEDIEERFGTGLCLGDLGSYYVMICRRCEDRPIQTTFQCS